MSDRAEEKFIAEGIRRYSTAVATIRTFETMLNDRLREVAKAYKSPKFAAANAPMDVGTSEGAFGHVVWAMQEGMLRGKPIDVWLEFGVWWRDDDVALYCGLVDEKNKGIAPMVKPKHPRVEFQKWSGKSRFFMLISMGLDLDLDAEFKSIFDVLFGSFK